MNYNIKFKDYQIIRNLARNFAYSGIIQEDVFFQALEELEQNVTIAIFNFYFNKAYDYFYYKAYND